MAPQGSRFIVAPLAHICPFLYVTAVWCHLPTPEFIRSRLTHIIAVELTLLGLEICKEKSTLPCAYPGARRLQQQVFIIRARKNPPVRWRPDTVLIITRFIVFTHLGTGKRLSLVFFFPFFVPIVPPCVVATRLSTGTSDYQTLLLKRIITTIIRRLQQVAPDVPKACAGAVVVLVNRTDPNSSSRGNVSGLSVNSPRACDHLHTSCRRTSTRRGSSAGEPVPDRAHWSLSFPEINYLSVRLYCELMYTVFTTHLIFTKNTFLEKVITI